MGDEKSEKATEWGEVLMSEEAKEEVEGIKSEEAKEQMGDNWNPPQALLCTLEGLGCIFAE